MKKQMHDTEDNRGHDALNFDALNLIYFPDCVTSSTRQHSPSSQDKNNFSGPEFATTASVLRRCKLTVGLSGQSNRPPLRSSLHWRPPTQMPRCMPEVLVCKTFSTLEQATEELHGSQ